MIQDATFHDCASKINKLELEYNARRTEKRL